MKTGIILLVAMLAGCSGWSKPGGTEQEFNRDQYECERDAAAQHDSTMAFYMKRRCMQLKGWRD